MVLLDEVEKAHLDVVNLFYQVFDKGVLADGEGRDIDFRNTVLFLTSNLASDVITRLCAGGNRPGIDEVTQAIRPILSRHFKPALLARMTIVPFYALDPSCMADIVTLKLGKLAQQMADNSRTPLSWSPEVVSPIAARCVEVESGARNIDHIMRGTIMPLLSRVLLARMGDADQPAALALELAEDGGFAVTIG